MKKKYQAVVQTDGQCAVKTQIRKNGHWYTVAETYAVSATNAQEMAEVIAEALNNYYAQWPDLKK
jgi:hypothetical protein